MKLKRWKLLTVLIAAFVLVATVSVSVYAYFSTRVYVYTEDGKEVAHLGMNLQLLFGKLNQNLPDGTALPIPYYAKVDASGNILTYDKTPVNGVTYYNAKLENPTFDPNAPWGSPQNPYIIANERHLQNLSALQNIGYFDMMYIEKNFDKSTTDGKTTYTYNNGISMPYFLICDENGKPVVIDATDIGEIKPVGSAEHPFIGVVGGAFASGDPVTVGATGKTTSVSTLHGVKVQTNTNQTDVGLFGYVGYLGTEPANGSAFPGEVSILQNFLLSDVQIKVEKPGLVESISEFFASLFGNNHNFTYTDKNLADNIPEPKETNHIGILAGHVSYAQVENISVYYSKDTIYAIDLTGNDGTNYHSSTGILGFMYNMNADVTNVMSTDGTTYNGHCQISVSGMNSDGVSVPSTGTGTGGGALSGSGRGYVTAAEIYSTFNYADAGDSMSDALWTYTCAGKTYEEAILIYGKANESEYTFADGSTARIQTSTGGDRVVTDANGATVNVNFFIRMENEDKNDKYTYYGEDGKTLVSHYEMMGDRQNGQQLWRFEAGGNGVWHYGILIVKNANGTYTLEDGNTAVTVANGVATDGTNSWTGYMVKTTVDGKTVYLDSTETLPVTSYNRKSMLIYGAVNQDGDNLCQQWYRDSLWSAIFGVDPEATGMYYFYDGVFTFALSSMDDTITDTWENNKAPNIYVGADDSTKWGTTQTSGNKAVIAFLREIKDNADLNDAIAENKQIYISARPNLTSQEAYLMTLLKEESDSILSSMVYLDSVTGDSVKESYESGEYTTMPLVPVTDRTSGIATKYENMFYTDTNGVKQEMSLDYLLEHWNDYAILNIGRTSGELPLALLQEKHNIIPTDANEYFYIDRKQDTAVENPTSSGFAKYYDPWDGYFYFVVENENYYGRIRHNISFYYQPPNNAPAIYFGGGWHTSRSETGYDPGQVREFYNQEIIRWNEDANGQQDEVNGELVYNGYLLDGQWVSLDVAAPLLDLTKEAVFYDSGTDAYVNGSKVTKLQTNAAGNAIMETNFVYYDVVSQKYYNNAGIHPDNLLADFNAETYTGTILDAYPSYHFSDSVGESMLSIIHRYERQETSFWTGETYWTGSKYEIWAGSGGDYDTLEYGYKADDPMTSGVLVFKDGKCFIRYSYGRVSKYVNFSLSGADGTFGTADTNAGTDTQLYIYVIEGVLDMAYGTNMFVPAEGEPSYTLPADQYVFWPQTTLKQDGVYSDNGTVFKHNDENATMTATSDPTYTLRPLYDLSNSTDALNWVNKQGICLGSNGGFGLTQKFQMADQAGFGPMLTLGDIDISLERPYTQLVAPVGSEGVEAVIPKGCVAFRVNEVNEDSTVRIIVAVPTTIYYMTGWDNNGKLVTETGFDIDLAMDYYIGLWQVGAVGDSFISQFRKSDAVEKFELPRSYLFDARADATTVDASKPTNSTFQNHVNVQYNGQDYRTYLNGGTVLVAYEFKVTEVGVYVIGSVHGDEDVASDFDCPMEIVHFSVSGTASAGNDGVSGSKIGSVDFVYDYADKIITVGTVGEGGYQDTEDYNNYYASRCLLFTANDYLPDPKNPAGFINLSSAKIKVQRSIVDANNPKRTTSIIVEGDNQIMVQLSRYSIFSDSIKRTPELGQTNATDSTS